MCDAGENLTPAARTLLGALLGEMRATVAEMYDADPDDVVIGPVDFGTDAVEVAP